MKSFWNDAEASQLKGDLGLRVYTSRLLGRDKSLVLHGGGNTSVKLRERNAVGEEEDILYVKGSGSDLAQIAESSFTPLYLGCVRRLFERKQLDNTEMMRLLDGCIARRPAPKPSIETLLHAALPFPYVEHTHADTVLALVNVERGAEVVNEVYGEFAPLVPYRHSGADLAKTCMEAFRAQSTPRTIGLILAFHGVVTFGHTARESYENMIRLVSMAEEYLKAKGAWEVRTTDATPAPVDRSALAALRTEVSQVAGHPLVMRSVRDPLCLAFARRDDLHTVSQQGPATPQHAVFTKRVPQIGRDVGGYAKRYRAYLARHLGNAAESKIDAAPRIVLDPEFGLCAFGINAKYAAIAADVYRHDIEIISRASAHGVYRSAPEDAIALAELEYGGFENRLRERAQSENC